MKERPDAEIKKLENQIKQCNFDLRRRPDNDKALYWKGRSYADLLKYTKDMSYANDALGSFNRAIEITEGSNPKYLVDRAHFHAVMGNNDLAAFDLDAVVRLPQEAKSGLIGKYIEVIVRDVLKHSGVTDAINELMASGQISAESAAVIQSYAKKSTSSLPERVAKQGKEINEQERRIEVLTKEVERLKGDLGKLNGDISKVSEGRLPSSPPPSPSVGKQSSEEGKGV